MATTPVDPRVVEEMQQCLTLEGTFGNPASVTHSFGWHAAEKVAHAREQIAKLINADHREIIFTSGATEADNLAIKGAAFFYQRKGKHIITMNTEHKAVLDTCHYLGTQGFEITYLNPEKNGILNLEKLKAAIRPDTILVTIMHVNNETGVIQDIAKIGEILEDKGIIFHVDAAQSAGKIPLDIQKLKVSTLSISGHKMYGPKGIGALYVRRTPRVRLQPQMHGGGHERGLRSGTLATHQIAGFGKAAEIAQNEMLDDMAKINKLGQQLWRGLSQIKGLILNGDSENRLANCFNFRIDDIDREALMMKNPHIGVSTGSACNSVNPEPSHVLISMGLTQMEAAHSIRLSIGRFTTEADIEQVIADFKESVQQLRGKNHV